MNIDGLKNYKGKKIEFIDGGNDVIVRFVSIDKQFYGNGKFEDHFLEFNDPTNPNYCPSTDTPTVNDWAVLKSGRKMPIMELLKKIKI